MVVETLLTLRMNEWKTRMNYKTRDKVNSLCSLYSTVNMNIILTPGNISEQKIRHRICEKQTTKKPLLVPLLSVVNWFKWGQPAYIYDVISNSMVFGSLCYNDFWTREKEVYGIQRQVAGKLAESLGPTGAQIGVSMDNVL